MTSWERKLDFLRRKNGFLEREKTISGENINFMREKNRYSEKNWISRESFEFTKTKVDFLRDKHGFPKREKKSISQEREKWISQEGKNWFPK